MRIYLGTETQAIDRRMQAWCEDRYGPDSCPAYRGVAYIVFEEIPLEDFGNRIPQLTVEAVSVKSSNYPYEIKTTSLVTASSNFVFSPSGNWMAYSGGSSGGQLEWWDVASRTNVGLSPSPDFATGGFPPPSLASDGTAYQIGQKIDGHVYYAETPPLGNPALAEISASPASIACVRVLENASGSRILYGAYSTAAGYIRDTTQVNHTLSARDFCADSSGTFWGLFQSTGTSSDFVIEDLTGLGGSHSITGLVSRSGPSTAYICHVDEYNHFFVVSDGKFYTIDDTTFTVKTSGVAPFSDALPKNCAEQNPYLSTVWNRGSGVYEQYSLEDASLIQSLDYTLWSNFTRADWAYDPVNHAIWTGESSTSNIHIHYLERIASAGVQLGAIVDSVCGWCGLTDKDTTALTQIVQGYSVTQGSGKDMIDPLLTIHDVDARPHDFQVQFVNRGSAPSGTILTEDFVRDQSRYTVTIKQDTDLPKKVTFNFADKNHDQQVNTVIAQRPLDAVDSQREETIDLSTYVATADEAQQFADRYFRRVWNSREEINLSLTAQYLAKEPADVTTVSLDGASRNVRFDKITLSGGALKCTVTRDETSFAALNTATTGPDMGARDDEFITIPSLVEGFVIDGPLIADADNDVNPLLYTGAGSWANVTFMGAGIFRGDDGTYDELFATVTTGATWGTANEALPNVNSPWLWDRGNSVNVTLQSGSLTSVTEADIDADPSLNLIAFGSVANGYEYLNFTTATLEGDGSYTLSGFKRGRRGTEWATGTHTIGDKWILASSLSNEELGTDDVGDSLSFKAQSIGRAIDAAVAINIDPYSGATLKPYAPARVTWTYNGTDLTGTIYRRTRVGGSWVGGSTIPLSENSEEYEIDVYNGATLKRTISVSGTNTFTYTAAMAAADGITLPTPPTINAYQLSDAVGRGYALAA
jgi:hypothetical protein